MERLINAVFLVLLASLPASARRARHVEVKTDAIESAERINLDKDNLVLQADGLQGAGESQSAVANPLMQEVRRADASFKTVNAHNMTQARGDAEEEFCAAMKVAAAAIVTKGKAAARAEFYKNAETGSDDAWEARKEADTAAAMLIDAEKTLWEKTELLSEEPFGGDAVVRNLLQDYMQGEETVERLMEVFHTQLDQLELEKFECIVGGCKKLRSKLSVLESQIKEMQGQESDSNEIDLTKPSVLEKNGMHLQIVKWIVDFIKVVQLDLLPNAVVETVEGMKPPESNQSKLVLDGFLMVVDGIEQNAGMESVINKATAEFVKAKISTSEDYRLAKDTLKHSIRAAMEQLQTSDPKMYESQKEKITNAIQLKQKAIAVYATLKQRNRSPADLKMRLHVPATRRSR